MEKLLLLKCFLQLQVSNRLGGSTEAKIAELLVKTQYKAIGELAAIRAIEMGATADKPMVVHLTRVEMGLFRPPQKWKLNQ